MADTDPNTDDNATEAHGSEDASRVRLDEKQWGEVAAAYKAGHATLEELSAKYGPSAMTVQRRMKKMGVVKGEVAAEVEKEATEIYTSKAAGEIAEELDEDRQAYRVFKKNHLKYLDFVTTRMMRDLAGAEKAEAEVMAALAAGGPAPSGKNLRMVEGLHDRIVVYVNALKGLKGSREGITDLLGVQDVENLQKNLPELVIRKMSDEERDAIRRQAAIQGGFVDEEEVAETLVPEHLPGLEEDG